MEKLDFNDITPIVIDVPIAGDLYELREASGKAACQYRNRMLACTTLGPDGKPVRVEGVASADPALVASCLFQVTSDPDVTPRVYEAVTEQKVLSWPDKVQKGLATRLKEISEIDQEDSLEELYKQRDKLLEKIAELEEKREPVKNEQNDTTDGSE